MLKFRRLAIQIGLTFAVLLLLVPIAAFAQAITAPPLAQTFDWTAVAINFITGFQVLFVPILTQALRNLLPSIPRAVLPFVALGFGVASDAVATVVMGGGFSPLRGALVGMAGLFLREIVSTFAQHGATKS